MTYHRWRWVMTAAIVAMFVVVAVLAAKLDQEAERGVIRDDRLAEIAAKLATTSDPAEAERLSAELRKGLAEAGKQPMVILVEPAEPAQPREPREPREGRDGRDGKDGRDGVTTVVVVTQPPPATVPPPATLPERPTTTTSTTTSTTSTLPPVTLPCGGLLQPPCP